MCEDVLDRIELTEKMTEKNSEYIQNLSEIVEQYMKVQNEYLKENEDRVNSHALTIKSLSEENDILRLELIRVIDYANKLNDHIKFLAEQILNLKVRE